MAYTPNSPADTNIILAALDMLAILKELINPRRWAYYLPEKRDTYVCLFCASQSQVSVADFVHCDDCLIIAARTALAKARGEQ